MNRQIPQYLGLFILLLLALVDLSGCSLIRKKPNDPSPTTPGKVVLRWSANAQLSGFNVYRSLEDGSKIKVNTTPVRPQAGSQTGIVPYLFEDTGLIAGRDYYYLREQIARDGTTRLWETPQRATAEPLR